VENSKGRNRPEQCKTAGEGSAKESWKAKERAQKDQPEHCKTTGKHSSGEQKRGKQQDRTRSSQDISEQN
jgi:hypothetical protein